MCEASGAGSSSNKVVTQFHVRGVRQELAGVAQLHDNLKFSVCRKCRVDRVRHI